MKRIIVIILILAFWISCAPKKIIKTPEIVLKEKFLPVTEEELAYYKEKIKTGKDSRERAEGAFFTGQYFYNKNNYKEALKYFEYNEKYYKDIIWGFLSILRMTDLFLDTKEYKTAIEKIQKAIEIRLAFPEFENEVFKKLEIILSKLNEEELIFYFEKHLHPIIDEYLIYYLTDLNYEKKDYEKFFRYANIFLSNFPDSKFFLEINKKFKEVIKFKPVNNKKFGVILPLSGKEVELGAMIKRGIEFALDEYNKNQAEEDKIKLLYIDEMDKEEKVIQNLINLIENENVIGLIGPLYSGTVKKLISLIDRYNIVLFSPTASQPELSGKSEYFFRNCATAKGQAYAIAKYIVENTNIKNIGILYPDTAYGRVLKNNFADKFKKLNGNIIAEVSFSPEKNDFKDELILLGGVNTNVLKELRSSEKAELTEKMKEIANKILNKVEIYFNLPKRETDKVLIEKAKAKITKKIVIAPLHFSPRGDNIVRYEIDNDTTRQLSFALAKDYRVDVLKQKLLDDELSSLGIEYEDIDREIALHIARKVKADVLVWGKIVEAETNTTFANFMPEIITDEKGNTKISYNFKEDDFFYYKIKIQSFSVADETMIFEEEFNYKKIKDPAPNPLKLEGLYIPASDKKMVLIKDQLKFYNLDLPVFGSSALSSNYILNFLESVNGIIFPQEFYPEFEDNNLQNFILSYKEKYATLPTIISTNSYDIMNLFINAVKAKILSREELKNYLKSLKNFRNLTGDFNFNEEGEPVTDFYIMKIEMDGIKFLKKVRGE